jgi:hypothetical protein
MIQRRPLTLPLLTFLVFAVLAGTIFGQEDQVEVSEVDFRHESLAGATDDWLEIAIELTGKGNAAGSSANPRFSDDIRVSLGLGFELAGRGSRQFRFFQAEVVVVTLEQGEKRIVFFYLPPEVVARDRLPKEPFAYLVELSVGGRPLTMRRANVSSNLGDATRVGNFKGRLTAEAVGTRGVLLPIYETPFFIARDKLRNSPAYRRLPLDR